MYRYISYSAPSQILVCRFLTAISITQKVTNSQAPFVGLMKSAAASNAQVYTLCRLLVAEGPPSPRCIGAAPPDAQAAVGVCWYIPAGKDTPAEPPSESARLPSGSTTAGPWPVVSKCALSRGPTKRTERPGHPRTLLPSVPSCWSITAFPACVIPLYFCYQIAISVDSSSTKLEITMVVSKTHQGQFYNKRNISFVYSSHKCSFKSSSAVIKYSIILPRRFTLSILLNYTSK